MELAVPIVPITIITTLLALALILFVLKPYLVAWLPDDIAGPDGFYLDTNNGEGILDFIARREKT